MNRKIIVEMLSFIIALVISVSIVPVSEQNVEAKKKNKKSKVTTISSDKPIVLKQTIPVSAAQKNKNSNAKPQVLKIKDLFNIRAKEYTENGQYSDDTGNPYNYKTIKDMKFKTLQGSCINGDYMYVAFTDKGRKNMHEANRDLTILAKINLKNKKVENVEKFYGLDTLNLYGLGHSNDLTPASKLINSAWYLHHNMKEKKKYDNRIGILNKENRYSYGGDNIVDTGLKGLIYIFGISNYKNKRMALGTVIAQKKKGKKKKATTVKKYKMMSYEFKNTSYEKGKKEFNLSNVAKIGKTKYKSPQCMEYHGGKFYIIRFNTKSKQDNNVIDIYKNKKHHKTILIKDPKGWKKDKWEVECFKYYSDDKSFYYTHYHPYKGKKIAYLYRIKKGKIN